MCRKLEIKQFKYSSMDEQIKNVVHIQLNIIPPQNKAILTFETILLDLEGIVLSEKLREKYCMILLTHVLKTEIIAIEGRMVVTRAPELAEMRSWSLDFQ